MDIYQDIDGFAITEFLQRAILFCRFCDFEHFREFDWNRTSRSIDEWT